MGYFEVWHKNSQKHVFVEIFLTRILSSWSYGSISVKEKLNVQYIWEPWKKMSQLSLKYLSSTLKSVKIHNFRVSQKDYFVGKLSKKLCVFSFSVNFLNIFQQISNISINRKDNAPDLKVNNTMKYRQHYYNWIIEKGEQRKKKVGCRMGRWGGFATRRWGWGQFTNWC